MFAFFGVWAQIDFFCLCGGSFGFTPGQGLTDVILRGAEGSFTYVLLRKALVFYFWLLDQVRSGLVVRGLCALLLPAPLAFVIDTPEATPLTPLILDTGVCALSAAQEMALHCFGQCGLLAPFFYAFSGYLSGRLELILPLAVTYVREDSLLSSSFNLGGQGFGVAVTHLALMGWRDAFSWSGALGTFFFFLMRDCFALGIASQTAILTLTAELLVASGQVPYFFLMCFAERARSMFPRITAYAGRDHTLIGFLSRNACIPGDSNMFFFLLVEDCSALAFTFMRCALASAVGVGSLDGILEMLYSFFGLCFGGFGVVFPSAAVYLERKSTLLGFLVQNARLSESGDLGLWLGVMGDISSQFKAFDMALVLLMQDRLAVDVAQLTGLASYVSDSLRVVFEAFCFSFSVFAEAPLSSVLWPTWGQAVSPSHSAFKQPLVDICVEAVDSVIDPYVGPQLDHLIARMDLWVVLFILPLVDELEHLF